MPVNCKLNHPLADTTCVIASGQDREDLLASLRDTYWILHRLYETPDIHYCEKPKVIGVHKNRGSARNGWYPGSQFVNYNTPTRAQCSLNLPPLVPRGVSVCQCDSPNAWCDVANVKISVQRAPSIVTTIADSNRRCDPYRRNRNPLPATWIAHQATTGPAVVLIPGGLGLGIRRAGPGEETRTTSARAVIGESHPWRKILPSGPDCLDLEQAFVVGLGHMVS